MTASAPSNGPTARRYLLRDHLSVRVTTDSSGAKVGEQGHYPYGEDWYLVDTTTERLFTTYQRDAQGGNDYAVHRYHSSSLGRFTTADPVYGASSAPQRLNRYAYVGGDPVNRRDPRGLYYRRDCSSFELPLGQSCGILPQTDKGGGGGSPMDIPWGPGGTEPPLPGLLPGGGFGYSGGTGGGYWGPAGAPSSGGPLGSVQGGQDYVPPLYPAGGSGPTPPGLPGLGGGVGFQAPIGFVTIICSCEGINREPIGWILQRCAFSCSCSYGSGGAVLFSMYELRRGACGAAITQCPRWVETEERGVTIGGVLLPIRGARVISACNP